MENNPRVKCIGCREFHWYAKVVRGRRIVSMRCARCFARLLDCAGDNGTRCGGIAVEQAKVQYGGAESASDVPDGTKTTTDQPTPLREAQTPRAAGLSASLDALGAA